MNDGSTCEAGFRAASWPLKLSAAASRPRGHRERGANPLESQHYKPHMQMYEAHMSIRDMGQCLGRTRCDEISIELIWARDFDDCESSLVCFCY